MAQDEDLGFERDEASPAGEESKQRAEGEVAEPQGHRRSVPEPDDRRVRARSEYWHPSTDSRSDASILILILILTRFC